MCPRLCVVVHSILETRRIVTSNTPRGQRGSILLQYTNKIRAPKRMNAIFFTRAGCISPNKPEQLSGRAGAL